MKVFFLILNKEEFLEEILEIFLELNITGATILDSVGMGYILSKDIPIFAGFRTLFQDTQPTNKTIMTIISEDLIETAINAIEQVLGPLDEPGNGLAFTIPVDTVYGLKKSFD